MAIVITDEMIEAAVREADRRDPHIHHHFELDYMTPDMRDQIGFLGEFACKEELNMDWRAGIRPDYEEPDEGDIIIPNSTVDIKTETIPFNVLMRLVRHNVGDDQPYGRRLITEGQVDLLQHYNYVVWGAFPRPDGIHNELRWYSLGYLETAYILENYRVTDETPFGSHYPEPCINVKHSELKPISGLRRLLNENI